MKPGDRVRLVSQECAEIVSGLLVRQPMKKHFRKVVTIDAVQDGYFTIKECPIGLWFSKAWVVSEVPTARVWKDIRLIRLPVQQENREGNA